MQLSQRRKEGWVEERRRWRQRKRSGWGDQWWGDGADLEGGVKAAGRAAVIAGTAGGGGEYDRATKTTRKGRDQHNLDGLLNSLVGGIIQDTLRYRSDIIPMAGVDTLTQTSALSESDQISYAGNDAHVKVNPMYGQWCTYHPNINTG